MSFPPKKMLEDIQWTSAYMIMHWLGSSHEGSDAQGCREGQADYKRQIDHDYQIRSVGHFLGEMLGLKFESMGGEISWIFR